MRFIISDDKKEAVKKAANIIADSIGKKPNSILELATGATMIPLYRELVRLYKKGKVDFSKVRTFNLDEYANISRSNPKSYHYYMNKNFFDKINIKKSNIHFPSANGKFYEKEIHNAGGIDLSILGIGTNGHIAFNEPGFSFRSITRRVITAEGKKAYTVGIETIMKSRKIILLAFGSKKADAVFSAIKGPITENVPASVLRRHRNVAFILDKKAAKKI